MNYAKINKCDIANGPGVRTTLFVSGCTNRCPDCFQPQTWDFNYGETFTSDTEGLILSYLKPEYIAGLTLLGGEPFEPQNQLCLVNLLCKIRSVFGDSKDIWCYTGFTYEQLLNSLGHPRCSVTDDMLGLIDVLVDGPFINALKDISLAFRGSSNQRIINVRETLRSGKITLLNFDASNCL